MEKNVTNRGFSYYEFTDTKGVECSVQKSSLACEDCIWIGPNNANPLIMASKASEAGISTRERSGWVEYPVHPDVLFTTRMHINQEQAKDLIKVLKLFVKTGDI